MKHVRVYALRISIALLLISAGTLSFVSYGQTTQSGDLVTVAFLDVGQGDAIFIEAPNGIQMLIDAGPNQSILKSLHEVMPYGDTTIDIVLATHTDADHIGGLASVLDMYDVGQVIDNGMSSKTKIYSTVYSRIKEKDIPRSVAHKGMRITLDREREVYMDILFPDRDISGLSSNEGSIVSSLVYGTHTFLFTGDAPLYTEHIVLQNEDPLMIDSTVLKLGHHGSHTSTSDAWLRAVTPELAIISAGKNNRYGHPHEDVLGRLRAFSVPYRATYDEGTIVLKTDGVTLLKK